MLKDYIKIAFGNMRKRFLRTSLTMLGVFIGIAAVVALISLGQGMKTAVNAQFASVGTDKIIVQGASAGFGPPGINAAGKIGKHELELVRDVQGVKRAAGRLLKPMNFEYETGSLITFAASLPESAEDRDLVVEANNIKIAKGRMLKPADRQKLLAGNHLWTVEHFPKQIILGSKISVNGERFEVVGLLDKIGAGRDEAFMMNEQDVRELFDNKEEFSAIIAQAGAGEKPSEISDRILKAIRRDRHQKEGFEDVTVETSEELIASINTILGVIQAVFAGIAAISLFVGGIGIMNTMYTSVLERTREIGVMKAIGARNSDILLLFILESGFLGIAGGAIGIAIGVGLAKTVEITARGQIGNVITATFPFYLILGSLAFSFVIGIVSGLFPARQAARLPPAEALRE